MYHLVYPKQEFKVRKAILKALEENTGVESGIGYNVLFERVKDKVGSKATFDSYLVDLQHDGYVTKVDDRRHKRGVVIYRIPEASELEILTIQMIEEIFDMFERTEYDRRKTIKPIEYDEDKIGKEFDYPSMWNLKAVANCILTSQRTLAKMLPKIRELYGETPFIKASEKNGKILLQFKPTQS